MEKHLKRIHSTVLRHQKAFAILAVLAVCLSTVPVSAMHIMEGFLPVAHCIFWGVVCLPFLIIGITQIKKRVAGNNSMLLLMAMAGAYIFVLSALKIPSVTGSCSHPTGTGLAAILFGPFITSVLGIIVLLFQAILLAHGGLTTLGANTFSMGIFGPILAYLIYRGVSQNGKVKNEKILYLAVFLASTLGDLMTYVVTSVQLAAAFPDPAGGFIASFGKFAAIFAVTQIPLAISEGILTVLIFSFVLSHNKHDLQQLKVIAEA